MKEARREYLKTKDFRDYAKILSLHFKDLFNISDKEVLKEEPKVVPLFKVLLSKSKNAEVYKFLLFCNHKSENKVYRGYLPLSRYYSEIHNVEHVVLKTCPIKIELSKIQFVILLGKIGQMDEDSLVRFC